MQPGIVRRKKRCRQVDIQKAFIAVGSHDVIDRNKRRIDKYVCQRPTSTNGRFIPHS